jgi:hypothetical protein
VNVKANHNVITLNALASRTLDNASLALAKTVINATVSQRRTNVRTTLFKVNSWYYFG